MTVPTPTAVICGVDKNGARRSALRFGLERNVPVIFVAVDYTAESFSVSVQEPGKACFACIEPDVLEDHHAPCAVPSAIDINAMATGLAVYALDNLIMNTRPISWNHRRVHAAGFMPGASRLVPRHPNCPVCSKFQELAKSE